MIRFKNNQKYPVIGANGSRDRSWRPECLHEADIARRPRRSDPYERADITSNTYYDWVLSQGYVIVAAQAVVGDFLSSFKDYPPSQRAQSFSIDQIVEKMQNSLQPPH